jgi:hypothetical protein
MADWRQIQARIRKAKASTDAPAQLAELYQRTRDAMVAFELAQWQEKAGEHAEAARWYTSAAERFRRTQWRTKAEEALQRLGAPVPVYVPEAASSKAELAKDGSSAPVRQKTGAKAEAEGEPSTSSSDAERDEHEEEIAQESADLVESTTETSEAPAAEASDKSPESENTSTAPETAVKKRRRRGRRGGRKRHTSGTTAQSATAKPGHQSAPAVSRPNASTSPNSRAADSRAADSRAADPRAADSRAADSRAADTETLPANVRPAASRAEAVAEQADAEPVRSRSSEPGVAAAWQGRTRAGEPAIASRISHLESQLRRLLACSLCSLEDADQAPAGPGVLLLSDSDQVTHYYVEACQTLRIGIGNLLRGGRGSKESGLLKQRMAENLGIGETRVGRYLNEHCAVRWLQLDEGAPDLAHFAIAVLRPVANE